MFVTSCIITPVEDCSWMEGIVPPASAKTSTSTMVNASVAVKTRPALCPYPAPEAVHVGLPRPVSVCPETTTSAAQNDVVWVREGVSKEVPLPTKLPPTAASYQ